MSIFSRIKNAIFGQAQAAQSAAPQAAQTPAGTAPSSAAAQNSPSSNPSQAGDPAAAQAKPAAAPAAAAPVAPTPTGDASSAAASKHVDIAEIMHAAVAKSGQKLDWRHSIVDFMKALGMDASLEERKELAAELGFTGDAHDSAKMNLFLHKALMKALAENGGKVPAELMD